MAAEFPFADRRQRPRVMGAAAASSLGRAVTRPDAASVAPSPHRIDPTRAVARGRSYVDFATVPGGSSFPHRDVLG